MPLITRQGKGSRLTVEEMDGNFTYLEELTQSSSGPAGPQGATGPQGSTGPQDVHYNYFSEEIKFLNEKVEYMTNQGYRLIIQFYPAGFIGDLREDKLNKLLKI